MTTVRLVLLFAVILLVGGPAALAHHGSAAYDKATTVKLESTITEFKFINPHAQIFFDVADASGHVTHWACEVDDPAAMERNGWKRDSLKPGDHVTIFGHAAKNGAPVMVLVKVVFANGQELLARV
jgi:hypothetical protein